MESIKIKQDQDYEKAVILCIFWSTRKTRTFEGCAPIFISKIATNNRTYLPISKKRLKLTLGMISDIQRDSTHFRPSEVEILIGNELLDVFFNKEMFYINTVKNKELESEITNKLKTEFNKVVPRMCEKFAPKILAQ